MDTNTIALVQTVAVFLALFGFWWRLESKLNSLDAKLTKQIKDMGTKLSGEIKGVGTKLSGEIKGVSTKLSGDIKESCQASETAHKEINDKLNAIERTQATHTERFNTIEEKFNTVQAQIQCVEDKVDRFQDTE